MFNLAAPTSMSCSENKTADKLVYIHSFTHPNTSPHSTHSNALYWHSASLRGRWAALNSIRIENQYFKWQKQSINSVFGIALTTANNNKINRRIKWIFQLTSTRITTQVLGRFRYKREPGKMHYSTTHLISNVNPPYQ